MATKSIAWNTGSGNITLTYQGQGDGAISIQSDANDGGARSQVITVETVGGAITRNLTISQAACPVPVGTVLNYQYTGSVQEVTLPSGQYKLQCWGAQGGAGSGYAGGKGGYSEGVITLTQLTKFYIFVGGQGGTSGNGGWNGGGGGPGYSRYNSGNDDGYSYFGCGGGATDISLVTSDMSYSSYRNNRSAASLLARMIVAGGGSGGSYAHRSYTTSSTSWQTIASGSLTYYSSWQGQYYSRDLLGHIDANTELRVSLSGLNVSSFTLQVAQYTISNPSSVYNATTTSSTSTYYTTPSGTTSGMGVGIWVFASSQPSGSYTIQKKVTTSSTSTSSDYTYGYVGGGVNGGGYSSSYYGKQNAAGSNGAFGLGANQTVTNYRYAGGCGGGGWYGGGNAYADSGIATVKYSGGGSGFVNTAASAGNRPSGYTGLQLDSGETKAGNTSFPNTAGTGNETGHSGNGYAKITRLS